MGNALEKPDLQKIMASIRQQAKDYVEKNSDAKKLSNPFVSKSSTQTSTDSPLICSEELNYLNANWHGWAAKQEITSHRKIIGPVIVKLKSFLVDVIGKYLFQGYFEKERQFQMNLVRYLNHNARYVDAKIQESFWQLIEKVDAEALSFNQRIDRVFEETRGALEILEEKTDLDLQETDKDFEELAGTIESLAGEIASLDSDLSGLRRSVISASGGKVEAGFSIKPTTPIELSLNTSFHQQPWTKSDLKKIVEILKSQQVGPVVELNCGKGELLEELQAQRVSCSGVETSESDYISCQNKGLDVHSGKVEDYLKQIPENSLGALVCNRVVETLEAGQLNNLVTTMISKLKSEGLIIISCVNPLSFSALSDVLLKINRALKPVHPEVLRFCLESNGVRTAEPIFLNKYSAEKSLKTIEVSEELPYRWRSTLNQVNRNIEQLNGVLYGYRNYCVVGTVSRAV
jgi:Methionine biosynthesis protein MetW